MTVPVSDRLSQLYVGNGTNTRFDFTFRVFQQEDETGIAVRVKVGSEFEYLDDSLYSVSLNQDEMGGYITFVEPPSTSTFFYIGGNTPIDQLLDITNYDNFYPEAIERALDKITSILQEWYNIADFETQARILADIDYDELAKQRESELKAYIDGIASSIAGQPVSGLPSEFVVHKGQTQFEINEEQSERKSVKLWSSGIIDALSKYSNIDFDNDETITASVHLSAKKSVTSNNHTINQTTPTTIVLESDFAASGLIIDGLNIVQDKSGPIGGGTDNNHAVVKIKGGTRNTIKNLVADGQLGLSFGMGEISASDRRSKFNTAYNIAFLNTHMGIEHIGASYNHTRNIVVAPTEFKGIFHGIRLTGYDQIENPLETAHAPCHGNTGSDYFVKNMSNGVSAQNSAKYNSYDRVFVTECDRVVQILQGTVIGNNPTLNHFNVIAEKVGQAIVNQGGNHNNFEILIDGGSFTDQGIQELTGYTGKGFNRYRGIIKNSAKTGAQFRYSHNLYALQVSSANGNGVNINGSYGGGTITVNGANGTGVSLAASFCNLQIIATECLIGLAVPGSGNIINIQTDGNVQVSGSGNTIIGRIGGDLKVTGNDNKFIGDVTGTVTRTGTTGNDFTGLKGWSGNIVLSEQITDGSGRVTVAVPKHASAQIRTAYATIPLNTSKYELKLISISGNNVMFELQNGTGGGVASTAVTFNYSYFCS